MGDFLHYFGCFPHILVIFFLWGGPLSYIDCIRPPPSSMTSLLLALSPSFPLHFSFTLRKKEKILSDMDFFLFCWGCALLKLESGSSYHCGCKRKWITVSQATLKSLGEIPAARSTLNQKFILDVSAYCGLCQYTSQRNLWWRNLSVALVYLQVVFKPKCFSNPYLFCCDQTWFSYSK